MFKLKEYWVLIVIILILLAGSFYWYEYKPMRLIKQCNTKAISEASKEKPEAVVNYYEFAYKLCLRMNGSAIK
jgi:hypothetical protein